MIGKVEVLQIHNPDDLEEATQKWKKYKDLEILSRFMVAGYSIQFIVKYRAFEYHGAIGDWIVKNKYGDFEVVKNNYVIAIMKHKTKTLK